jgi:type II secretion system protein G
MQKEHFGFTLIELLIVVAIIAILAAIAIPNFLAAQTRSKVSRVRSDMRTAANALESYRVDNDNYPAMNDVPGWAPLPTGYHTRLPISITTPISYITRIPTDTFMDPPPQPAPGVTLEQTMRITYWNYVQFRDDGNWYSSTRHRKAGDWLMLSWGPDRVGNWSASPPVGEDGMYTNYDPTNGTVSIGNLIRTMRNTDKYDSTN